MVGSGHSAYSKQTYETCTRLVKAGHWVGHIPMGRCNRMAEIMIDGVLVLKSGLQIFCEDVIHYYATKYRADIVITLKEEWAFMAPPHGLPGSALAWVPFNIVDHEPLSPAITSRILTAFKTISPSRHSQRLVTGAGIEADYIPHGISCSDFHILEGKKAECKKLWLSRFTQKPEEDFTILVGPARNQARKMLPIQLRGIARFYEQNPDAARHSHVILWTDVRSASRAETEEASLLGFATQGADLLPEIVNLGILDHVVQLSEGLIAYGVPDWAGDNYGVGGEDLCKLYNAADVELNCTGGECFGMTQIEASACGTVAIATDYAGGAEHVGPGLTVRQDGYMVLGSGGHRYAVPSVDGIAEALKKMYNTDREKLGHKARRWSTRFDWDNVMPIWDKWLDKTEQDLRPRVTSDGIRKWD